MRGLSRFLLLISLLLIAGCSSVDSFIRGMVTSPNPRVTTETYDGVIFTQDNAENAGMDWLFNDPLESYWTPSEADIADLETQLPTYLKQTIPAGDWRYDIQASLSSYKRQYIGTVKAGDPYIWANFFCSDSFDDWQTRVVFVMDGGLCFFNVWYNTATHEFSDLQVNGFA